MANPEHVKLLRRSVLSRQRNRQGVGVWNEWRTKNLSVTPDLSQAHLTWADPAWMHTPVPNLSGVNFTAATLTGADFKLMRLTEANLSWADLTGASFLWAQLDGANLTGADLSGATLLGTNLAGANLTGADLTGANLTQANLARANLTGADLSNANLVETDLADAVLTGCKVYGISSWNVKLSEDTKQQDLVITRGGEPEVTVDNIEVAQFVYLLLHNEKIRDIIDTVGRKGVLLLGRFTEGRIAVLERLREELRKRGYLPIVFNFDKPETKDFTETVRLLAGLSHFVIADITNPKSAPLELQATVPEIMVPFRPIIEEERSPSRCSRTCGSNTATGFSSRSITPRSTR